VEDYYISGFSESELGDSTSGVVLDTLILTYKEVLSPIPLPTYLGKIVLGPKASGENSGCFENTRLELGKEYTWSKGLVYEHSPIKTRSVCRKEGPSTSLTVDFLSPHTDIGVLRGMKSLARAKP
jgi:hypothetical protein